MARKKWIFFMGAVLALSLLLSQTAFASGQQGEEVTEDGVVELSFWSPQERFSMDDRRNEIPYEMDLGMVEEKFGVKINYTLIPKDAADEKMSIMLATNDLTDLIYLQGGYDKFSVRPDQLLGDGQIIDLMTVKDNMPDYYQILEDNVVLMKNVTNNEDQILYFGEPIFEQEVAMSGGLMIRRDWVEKAGMNFPETMEEYIDVLRWVKNNDANGNGIDDEVPFCGSHGSLQVIGNLTGIQDSFSMDGGSGGQVIYAPLHKERYKTRLKLMRIFVEEKLINEDYYNFDFSQRDTWVSQDRVGGALTGLGNIDKWNLMMDSHETFLMWPLSNPEQSDGKRYFDRTMLAKAMDSNGVVITTQAKHPDKAAEFINYFYTEEGHDLAIFGVEGVTYNMVNGWPKYTDLIYDENNEQKGVNKYGISIVESMDTYLGFPGIKSWRDIRKWAQLSLNSPGARQANIRAWTDPFTPETNTAIPPAMMTEDDAYEFSKINADLDSYLLESIAKFTNGTWDIEADYDKFYNTLIDLKAEEALVIMDRSVKAWQQRGGKYEFTMGRAEIDWSQIELRTEKGIEFMDPSLK